MSGFASLSRAAQVRRLRAFAARALDEFPIEVTGLRLLAHEYNTSFRVDAADGRRFALRINVGSRRRPEWTASEMAWLAAIAGETDLWVPAPLPTRAGELSARVEHPELGRALTCVVFEWLPGRDLGDAVTPAQMREVGRTMARLHDHAERWQPPPGFELPRFDEPLFGAPDNLTANPALSPDERDLIRAVIDETARHHDAMFAGVRPIPLHADLHQWNLKWSRGRLAVFDFDDSGLGVPVQDLAISAYYVRRVDRALEEALHDGYASIRPLPDVTSARYEANLATRNLVLLNDVITTENAATRAMLPDYVPRSIARLRHWLDTGEYRFDV